MFTIKFYTEHGPDGGRSRIYEAESFTILRGGDSSAEITLHQPGDRADFRVDIGDPYVVRDICMPIVYERAIIENSHGRTSEIVRWQPEFAKDAPRKVA